MLLNNPRTNPESTDLDDDVEDLTKTVCTLQSNQDWNLLTYPNHLRLYQRQIQRWATGWMNGGSSSG